MTKAAERLYITQPTLSRQIAETEDELGTPLFVRSNRKVTRTDAGVRRRGGQDKPLWLLFAVLSAVFAAATSLLANAGIENVDSNLATAVRTSVVLVLAWLIVFCRGKAGTIKAIRGKELLFLLLSGLATGISWLCYYYAIRYGQVSVVVPIDRLSILVTVLFACLVLKEKLSPKAWAGLGLLTAGTVCMAIFT